MSGVGKTTILKEAAWRSSELIWLEGSRLVLDAAGMPLDEFKRLDEPTKYDLREKAIHRAMEIQEQQKRNVVIDGHMIFATGEGQFENVMTAADASFYTDYIYLHLPPQVILQRQQRDPKSRRTFSESTLSTWMEVEMEAIRQVCDAHEANLHVLESQDNDHCVEYILNFIQP